MDINLHWYAIRVRSRAEKKVFADFCNQGFDASLPLIKVVRKWSDRQKEIKIPLFSGYVFVKIDFSAHRFIVLGTNSVVNFVGMNGKCSPIPHDQMYWLDHLHDLENVLQVSKCPNGSPAIVTSGPLTGLTGRVIQEKSRYRLTVWFDTIMQGLSIDVDRSILKSLSRLELSTSIGV